MAFDYLPWQQKETALGTGLESKLAANTYARFLNKQRGSRKLFDVNQGFERQTPGFIGSYTKRGLAGPGVQSGVFQRGLQQFGEQQFNAQQAAQDELNAQNNQLDNEEAGLRAQYAQDLADLQLQKNAQIAQSAATLAAFKPYLN